MSFGAICTAVLVPVQHQHMESFFLADDLCRLVENCGCRRCSYCSQEESIDSLKAQALFRNYVLELL